MTKHLNDLLAAKPLPVEAQEEILRHFDKLCWKLAFRMSKYPWAHKYGVLDDWYQEARIELLLAADRFDVSRGTASFMTFAHTVIWNNLRRTLDAHNTMIRVPLKKLLNEADHYQRFATCSFEISTTSRHSIIEPAAPSEESPMYDSDDRDLLLAKLAFLNPRSQYVLNRRHRDSAMLHEIAKELDLTKERVRQIELKAREQLRQLIRGDDADKTRTPSVIFANPTRPSRSQGNPSG